MKLVTYLAGSIQAADECGTVWRDKLTPKLEALGVTVQDPCKSECNKVYGQTIVQSREQIRKLKRSGNWEKFDEHMREIIRDDLKQVNEANFLVVYWNQDYRHGGTVHEIAHAWSLHIPVYLVNYDALTGDKEMNDWVLCLVRQNGQVFSNFGQLVDFIQDKYKNELKEIMKERDEAAKLLKASAEDKSQSDRESKDEKK